MYNIIPIDYTEIHVIYNNHVYIVYDFIGIKKTIEPMIAIKVEAHKSGNKLVKNHMRYTNRQSKAYKDIMVMVKEYQKTL